MRVFGSTARPFEQLGAQVVGDRTLFRVFSDCADRCEVRILNDDGTPRVSHDLAAVGGGYREIAVTDARQGTLYEFVLDGNRYPDPYARYLPRGVHGPAMVVEDTYEWENGAGVDRPLREQIIYEIHVGTFTAEGTFAAAALRLPDLVDLGVTTVELMPLSAFPGDRGWGYDGVAHFAPHAGYGTPDDLRRLVDQAHGLGLGVILDVVYNHFGPSGNYLSCFSPAYFSPDCKNAWGDGPNFCHPVMRNFALANAHYWLTDFRFDGLRLDATHAIVDPSPTHILKELADLAHGLTPRKLVIAEDERNDSNLVTQFGLDAVWADDFHHVAHVSLTGENDGYYASYSGGAAALAEAIGKGWLYTGQVYPATGKPRGKPATGLPREALVYCLQNHDQVGNRAFGDRLAGADRERRGFAALSTVLLFLPATPLLFMGQEWGATTPFQFFTDHDDELGRLISTGRREEFKHFHAFAHAAARDRIPDPQAEATFIRSKLKWDQRNDGPHARVLALYKLLLRLRRSDPVLGEPSREGFTSEARDELLVVRRHGKDQERILLANLGDRPIPAPAIAAVLGDHARRSSSLLARSDMVDEMPGQLPGWTAVVVARDGLS